MDSINQPMIFAGGTLIFIAATLLLLQLWNVRGGGAPASLKFYITGIFYLLVGIIIGTGLWLNWSEALYIKVPLEAHIHANSWGFMSLVFAGLLAGRRAFGWRGPAATRWVYAGAAMLLLAYAGSRFVLEVLLHRIS